MKKSILSLATLFLSLATFAQKTDDKSTIAAQLDKKYHQYANIARTIWTTPELGYQEVKSSATLQAELRKEGFKMEVGVADMPTSFIGSYGSGRPIIAILAEFDALPGLSQDSVPYKKPIIEGGNGHGCGHNLFGTASVAAATALKNWLTQTKRPGTIRLYGTPAEEGGGGKVYMTRAGLFNDVDAVLHWHPSDDNNAESSSWLSQKQAIMRFYGRSSHAAAAPEVDRSALDAAEAMNYMVNMMREHMDEKARIHYVIKKGGLAANVVPDYVEMEYKVRHPKGEGMEELWQRVLKCAQGAALGTETRFEYEVISGYYEMVPNDELSRAMDANLRKVGGVTYTPEETAFAEAIQKTLPTKKAPPLSNATTIQPFRTGIINSGSSDVSDISWVVPTAGVYPATWVPGTAAHTWQATAADGMSIGFKGMMVAAKTMAMTGIDLFTTPELIVKAKAELEQRRGPNWQYKCLVGDRKPPLNYRSLAQ